MIGITKNPFWIFSYTLKNCVSNFYLIGRTQVRLKAHRFFKNNTFICATPYYNVKETPLRAQIFGGGVEGGLPTAEGGMAQRSAP